MNHSPSIAPISTPSSTLRWLLLAGVVLAGAITWALWPSGSSGSTVKSQRLSAYEMQDEKTAFAGYAGSASCQSCHSTAYEEWADSHHGLAERSLRDDLDKPAFDPAKSFSHGMQTTDASRTNSTSFLTSLGFGGERKPWKAERVIGHNPLRQFLTAGTGGRLHAMEACWDPKKNEWFNVYGDEDRKPGEWGHWTGRGMVWNQMCASCHNTRLRKNYDAVSDTYRTTMAEMTVSCESCHGPMKPHVDWQALHAGAPKGSDPTAKKFTHDQMTDNCAGCHARRGELTGDFVPGDSFWDHYRLTITDHTDIFHPDGQIRDENYEFTSFFSSRMYHAGVRCADCHQPHSAKTLLKGNDLCMKCHTPGSYLNAPAITPEPHSFHKADSTGNQCVNCHMPQTTYMQRHPRHDHGFTIPDPLLTKLHGTPNACNKCHTEKDTDWALAATEKWWGPRMDRKTRTRAKTVAKARRGDDSARPELLALLESDETPSWKATATLLLDQYLGDPTVSKAIQAQAKHPHAAVRTAAATSLDPLMAAGDTAARETVKLLLTDPSRSVRNAAAWTLRETLDEQSPAGRDLLHYLKWNADQPSGQMQLGQYHFARGQKETAITHLEKAIEWDPNSPPFHHDLALMHSSAGNSAKALASMLKAAKLAPQEASYQFELGLAWSEAGSVDNTIVSLKEAVRIDPAMGRAWYNLGLALNAKGQLAEALQALQSAESATPGDPGIPFARATILTQLKRTNEARAAALRALQIQPNHAEAGQLLQMLQR